MTDRSNPAYGVYCLVVFLPLALSVLLINLFLPSLRARRAVARRFSRLFLRVVRIHFEVRGIEHLPEVPCVVVANHASYLDGMIVAAALPPSFAFVIKKEMARVPLISLLLKRLGSEFVERFDRHKGAMDTRRVLRRAASGQSIVFFPEGTFTERRAIGKFHGGAFATAARNHMPVVALALTGTRDALPSGTLLMRRVSIRVQILSPVLNPAGSGPTTGIDTRQRARAMIAEAVGEALSP